MDRPIVYPGSVPADTDILTFARANVVALAALAQTVLGAGPALSGFSCTPAAGLKISVGLGVIYEFHNLDDAAYGSLPPTNYQVLKQGLSQNPTMLSCPAPSGAGQSIAYLVQIGQQDQDGSPVVLEFYDSSNPSVPYTGPNNSQAALNTVRASIAVVSVKAGVAAATGSQVAPAPDAGFIGAWVVTVPNGATSVNGGMIALAVGAPFVVEVLQQKISEATADGRYQPLGDYLTAQEAAQEYQPAGHYLASGEAAGGDLAGDYPNPTIGPSVALRGSPTTTTQAPGDDSSKVATTAYTDAAIAAIKAAFNSATDGFDLPGYSQRVGSLIAPAGISTATLGRGMPTTILFVQACPSTSGSPPPQISAYITPASPSATQFFINNASSGPVAVDYVAYGH